MSLEEYLKTKGIKKENLENYIKRNIDKKEVGKILDRINYLLEKLKNYRFERYIPLLKWITSQYTGGFFKELKNKNAWELLFSLLIIKSAYEKNYPTSIIYTTQTKERGRGYYLSSEEPTEEELINEFLKHINSFYRIQWYSRREGYLYEIIAYGKLMQDLKRCIEDSPLDNNGFSFSKVCAYNKEIISIKGKKENLIVKYPNIVLFIVVDYLLTKMAEKNERPLYTDFSEIHVVSNKLVNRRYYIFPNISEIYYLFYKNLEEDFIIDEEVVGLKGEKKLIFRGSKLSKFLLSLWIKHPDYSEESLSLLDKLIYYLFNYVKLNGEILNKLVNLIVTYSRKERVIKIKYLCYVLNKFWNIKYMKPTMIEEWANKIGKYMLSEEYKNKYNLDEKRAKKRIERIIDELKVENVPGRFFEKLVRILKDYELPIVVDNLDITKIIKDEKVKNNMDNFFYVKALILSGLLKSL